MPLASGMRLGRYELLAPLGVGGMGEVFRARDQDLAREVAIKFLPARFASDADRLARFSQEARAASSLNHPNIVTIHEIGEAEGQPYIVMELVEGQTLRALLAGGRLPARQTLDLAAQIADGLAKAHAAVIVHRDLKPENVMVTGDGVVKIVDFGLAKLRIETVATPVAGATSGADAETVTRLDPGTVSGAILGTAGYMAPEQAAGRPVDYRADQFSLGTMLYEMATGTRAFQRDSVIQTLNAIIESEPAPLAASNPAFPAPARWIVERCLAKQPTERYASTLDLARELRGVRDDLSEASNVGPGRPAPGTRPRLRLRLWHAILGLVVIALGVLFGPPVADTLLERLHVLPLPDDKSIAVLPIHNPGGTPEEQRFYEGMLEYLVARLGQLDRYQRNVWVVPAAEVRRSGMTTSGGVYRALGARLAVDITVQRLGDRAVMSASLVDTAHTRQLRGATTETLTAGVLPLDQVVDAVVNMLELELGSEARAALRAGGTSVAEASTLFAQALAYTPYEQARNAMDRYEQQQRLEQAVTLFNAALERDPRYALAHAGLGEACLRLYQVTRAGDYIPLAEQQCQRALELDSLIAPAWVTLGLLHTQTGKPGQAVADFQQALARDPRSADAHRGLASAYERLKRPEDAEKTFKQAIALRPNSWSNHSYLGAFLYARGRYGDAEAAFRRALELAPDNARVWSNLGGTLQREHRLAEAEDALKKSIERYPTAAALSNLGTLQFSRRDYADAVVTCEWATKLNDRDYRVWRNLGAAYYWAPGMRSRASAAYHRSIELAEQERRLDPHNASLLVALADCKAMTGDAASAHALLTEGLKLAPADNETLKMAADVYETLGDRTEALRWLDLALAGGYPRSEIDNSVSLEQLRRDPRYATIGTRAPAKTGEKGR